MYEVKKVDGTFFQLLCVVCNVSVPTTTAMHDFWKHVLKKAFELLPLLGIEGENPELK